MNRKKRHRAKKKAERNAAKREKEALGRWADKFAPECAEFESAPEDSPRSGREEGRGGSTVSLDYIMHEFDGR